MKGSNKHNPLLHKTLLALAVAGIAHPTYAADETTKKKEDTVVVEAKAAGSSFKAGGDAQVPAFLEGQVAHGGRLGVLGEQKAMDVPFNVISFTSKMVKDQQAKTVGEVLRNDAAVQPVQGYGNFSENYRIRGFELSGDDVTWGGLSGVLPRQVVDSSLFERVEVFKGASSFVNGAATSGVGGMVNMEPKHADDLPLMQLGVDYTSASQLGTTLDAGRRFGDDSQFGVRVNMLHREGETAIDGENKRTTLASLGFDYRGEKLRTSLDVAAQKKTFHGGTMGVNLSGVDFVPDVPHNTDNYSQKWGYSDITNQFGMARAEYDILDNWTIYAGAGAQHAHEKGIYTAPKLLNKAGDATADVLYTNRIIDAFSSMAGIRGEFDTGPVSHKINLGYSAMTKQDKIAWRMNLLTPGPIINIYNNQNVPMPQWDSAGGNYDDPLTTGRNRTQGYLFSDTLGFFDDTVLFTAAARHQKVAIRSYSNATGAEDTSSRYTDSRWMPTFGIVYKPQDSVSLYANHTEALQPGQTIADRNSPSYGQSVGILHSKQNEVGVKIDFGTVGGSLALFEIKKPSVIQNQTTKEYSADGEQRNRGVEVNLFGEPMFGLRLNSSATWLQPKLTKTQGGLYDGNDASGTPRFSAVLGAEYDIPNVEGLTATARLNHTGSQYDGSANKKKLDHYTTLNIGARYRMRVNQDQNELVWRLNIDNVTNEEYWSGVSDYDGVYVFRGEPRTLKLSLSYDF
ncbi:TonB-dependent receptor [Pectobacterium cacticida]|uniref:TonB-dependent receptor n=1 Tax=Pectobacterium cacticida TaxID=69221 RepID=UPI0039871A99